MFCGAQASVSSRRDGTRDLVADLNAEDDGGLGWSTRAEAAAPERVRPGATLLADNNQAQAEVRVVAVDDGQRSCPLRSAQVPLRCAGAAGETVRSTT